MKDIPTLLAEWRKRRKLKQSEAATFLDVSLDTFRNWEYGRNTPGKIVEQYIRGKCK
jgi:DNA-binding transcriptional regulator YiaG